MPKHRALQTMLLLCGLAIGGLHWSSAGTSSAGTAGLGLSGPAAADGEFPAPGDAALEWPRDHGAKRNQLAEYWLFAGLLADEDGRQYGFQLAFFRLALQAGEPRRDSAWAARDIYRAHLVITAAAETHASERYSRAALGLSGADDEPIRLWLEDWRVAYDERSMTFHVDAADAEHGLDLRLALPAHEPLGLQGAGYRGYWWTGLTVDGDLRLAGRRVPVAGRALLDRLWGRVLPVGRGQLALSRLWLELDDGTALRCRQLRRRAGGGTPLGECLLRRPDGSSQRFERDRISLEPEEHGWRNLGGVRYPLSWRLQLADHAPALHIRPFVDEQEKFALPLWSGTVQVGGRSRGWGVLELSNYAAPEPGGRRE